MGSDGRPSISVDGYQNFTRIGTGGFSSVFRAEQAALGREVAIKVLHADLTTEEERQTFERECRALGLLSRHPNIVTVYHDAVAGDGRRCIVMELYHGTVREQIARGGPRPIAEVLQVGVKIGSALQVAHDAGVLHRDVKPHNILWSDYGEPALSDFGISVIDVERSVSAASGLSLAYASPEALDGRRATRASDIYSLGATLFHLLEGEPPFSSPRMEATLTKIMTEPPPELSSGEVPASLRAVLRDCLAKAPADRPESAAHLVAALREVEAELGGDRTPIPQRRSGEGQGQGEREVSAEGGEGHTVAQPGSAVDAALGRAVAHRQPRGPDGETSVGSNPSLWPPGWSPWENADQETVVRASPAGRQPGKTPSSAVDSVPAVRGRRRLIGVIAVAVAVAVAIGVAAMLLG